MTITGIATLRRNGVGAEGRKLSALTGDGRSYRPRGLGWGLLLAVVCVGLLVGPARAQVFGPPAVLNTNAASEAGSNLDPQLTTDGAGNWVAVWESDDDLGGTIGYDDDILVARSADNGATWTAPAALNTNAATDTGWDWYPQVTTDGAGNWVAVWWSYDPSAPGRAWYILVARSADNGATWTAPAALYTSAVAFSGVRSHPQLTTDGAGNWVAVWKSFDDLGGTIGTDSDILVARSVNNGATWTAPAALNTNAGVDAGEDRNPQLTTDGAGNWVAVWDSTDYAGTDSDILVALSADNGATWSSPRVLGRSGWTDAAEDSRPQLTTDGAGNWVAVWDSVDLLGYGTFGTDSDILVARSADNGATWTWPVALNTNAKADAANDWDPQLTTDGAGNWVAVWKSFDDLGGAIGTDSDILVARSANNGATWSAPLPLNTNAGVDAGEDRNPQLTTDGAGNWVAVWDSEDTLGGATGLYREIFVARAAPRPARALVFGPPVALNTNAEADAANDGDPQLTTDGAGNWVAVWKSFDDLGGTIGTDSDILVARSVNNGATWTAPLPLNTNAGVDAGEDRNPQLTTDGAGNWVAVWESEDDLGGTIGTDSDILVARSVDNGASWTVPVELNTNAGVDRISGDSNPELTTDGAGNWVAVWDSDDSLAGTIGRDRDILVARSVDNGITWTAPAALNTNASFDVGFDVGPQLTTDGAGNWVAVWYSFDDLGGRIGTDWDILVARSVNNGASWTVPVELNTNAGVDRSGDGHPQLTTDGAGNWVAVWHSEDDLGGTIGPDPDILVARSVNNGARWTAPAALNTNAATDTSSDDDRYPQLTTDGAGNWVAVWMSSDDLGGTIGTDYDILVARSVDNGATWTAPVALNTNAATDAGNDLYPQLTTDGAGNWVAVWDSDDDLGGTIGNDYNTLVARGALCGDGFPVSIFEECDDGNSSDGDGCSARCTVEPGYSCSGEPSVCTQFTLTATPTPTRTHTQAVTPTQTPTRTPTPLGVATPTPTPAPGISGSLTASDPTFRRPAFTFTQGGQCELSMRGNRIFFYDVYEFFNPGGPISVTASNCPANGGWADFDSVMAIYQSPSGERSAFEPSAACMNALAYNDNADLPGCVQPAQVSAVVQTGYYYVVVSSFDTQTTGSYRMGLTTGAGGPFCHTACDCPAGMGCLLSGFCSATAAVINCCESAPCPPGQQCEHDNGQQDVCGVATLTPTQTPTPTLTPTQFVSCTPPLCMTPQVFYCPADCPGGCGTICVTPTPAVTATDTRTRTGTVMPTRTATPTRTASPAPLPVLAAAIGETDTEITLSDASPLPNSGTIRVDDEVMTYAEKHGNTLTGIVRGADGKGAREHSAGAQVMLVGLPGDANCDGAVTAADLPALAGQISIDDSGPCGGDANNDGELNELDAAGIIAAIFSR